MTILNGKQSYLKLCILNLGLFVNSDIVLVRKVILVRRQELGLFCSLTALTFALFLNSQGLMKHF